MEVKTPGIKEPQFNDKEKRAGKYVKHAWQDHYLEVTSDNNTVLRVYVINEQVVRVRYSTTGYFEDDFSYAIDPDYRSAHPKPEIKQTEKVIFLKTKQLMVKIQKDHLLVNFYKLDGTVLLEEEKGFHWEFNEEHGGNIVQMTKKIRKTESFFGLGDKAVPENLLGKRFMNWGMDEYGFHAHSDPLYKNINFYLGKHEYNCYGVFFDNTFCTNYDFGRERSTVSSFWSEGGEMNYYFFTAPSLLEVSSAYTLLTGTPEMPPLWALGYQQCKWSYYPEANVKEITGKMRELKIPCDAIYLDIDYMDGFRCFTWDYEKFPDPKRMVAELNEQGFKTMVIIDPGIKIDSEYSVFNEALENDYFCKTADGPYILGKVWPGDCYFPDFTHPQVREWWKDLFKGLIEDVGVAGVWNDMNEPALFEIKGKTFPVSVRHDYDGHPCSHRKAHNVYGMQMARATFAGVKKFAQKKDKRSLVITRSGYSGLQRFSSVWTGDNIASWEHLRIGHVQTQRLSISGISFNGTDIGGFTETPDGELFARWMQLAIFHPFFRTHSSGDHGDQEPWSFGEEALNVSRKFIELRYKLLPQVYSAFYQYHKFGTPMLRPLAFSEKASRIYDHRKDECYFGDHILFCPILEKGVKEKVLYLPEGNWFDYTSNLKMRGNRPHRVKAALDEMPIFVREGALLAEFPVQQYVGEKEIETVALKAYYKEGRETSSLYFDDYDGYSYENGQSRYSTFHVSGDDDSFDIRQEFQGDYKPKHAFFDLEFIGVPFRVDKVVVNGYDWKSTSKGENGQPIYRIPLEFKEINILAIPGTQESQYKPMITILNEEYEIPQLGRTRRIAALLPHDYVSSDKRYPVIYLHDGQNLYEEDAPYGNWGLDDTMHRMAMEGKGNYIIIAVDHGNKMRLNEYSPFDNERFGKGQGEQYLEFLMETLKPYVDRHFRTLPDRQNTAIGGSSLGGLISLYAGFKHPEAFGKLLIFSPSLWLSDEIYKMAEQYKPTDETRIYHYSGQKESEEHYANALKMAVILKGKKANGISIEYEFSTHPDGRHHEWYWGDEAPEALEWLFHPDEKLK